MRCMRVASVAVMLFSAAISSAQPAAPSFEAASIKPSTAPPGGQMGQTAPDRFGMSGGVVTNLIAYAYELPRFRMADVPDWIVTERFDVDAKAASPQTPEQMRLMVRRLLVERFGMKSRLEPREMPVLALRAARSGGRLGNQLKPTAADCGPIRAARGAETPRLAILAGDGPPVCTTRMSAQMKGDGMVLRLLTSGMTMPQFGSWLSPYVNRPVVDQTGWMGDFDIELLFAVSAPSPAGGVADDPPIVTAVQEQLGLRMVSTRAPVDVLVIESIERPSAN